MPWLVLSWFGFSFRSQIPGRRPVLKKNISKSSLIGCHSKFKIIFCIKDRTVMLLIVFFVVVVIDKSSIYILMQAEPNKHREKQRWYCKRYRYSIQAYLEHSYCRKKNFNVASSKEWIKFWLRNKKKNKHRNNSRSDTYEIIYDHKYNFQRFHTRKWQQTVLQMKRETA